MEKYCNVIFKTFYFTFNYMCMCEGMCMKVQVSAWRNQEGIRYSKAGVTNGCEPLGVHAWDEIDPLKG